MDILLVVVVIIAVFFAVNIGGNTSASAMGAAFGGGAITGRRAVMLIAVFTFLGAVTGSSRIITTIGNIITIPDAAISTRAMMYISILVILTAGGMILVANLLRVPLSTTQATVGGVIGAGAYLATLNVPVLMLILSWWLAVAGISFGVAYVLGRSAYPRVLDRLADMRDIRRVNRTLNALLVISGCYVAFSIGTNNTGVSMGLAVASGLDMLPAAVIGGAAISAGALLIGPRVLRTVGKDITQLCNVKASMVSFTSGTLIIVSSLLGIPVSIAVTTTMAIVGIGASQCGYAITFRKGIVRDIVRIWVLAPLLAALVTFTLIRFLIPGGGV